MSCISSFGSMVTVNPLPALALNFAMLWAFGAHTLFWLDCTVTEPREQTPAVTPSAASYLWRDNIINLKETKLGSPRLTHYDKNQT